MDDNFTYLLSVWQLSPGPASWRSPSQTRTTLWRVPAPFWWWWCKRLESRRTRFRSHHRKSSSTAAWCPRNSRPCNSCSPPTFSPLGYPLVFNPNVRPGPKLLIVPRTLSRTFILLPRFSFQILKLTDRSNLLPSSHIFYLNAEKVRSIGANCWRD